MEERPTSQIVSLCGGKGVGHLNESSGGCCDSTAEGTGDRLRSGCEDRGIDGFCSRLAGERQSQSSRICGYGIFGSRAHKSGASL